MRTTPSTPSSKSEWRDHLLAARRARDAGSLRAARAGLAGVVLDQAARRGWRRVAAYEPLRTEPGSVGLLAGLAAAGVDVLVPVTLPDRDLDWRRWPSGPALGVDAVAQTDAVLVPALAVAADGTRLGRGGGSYDRALARCGPEVATIALLFDGELVDGLPREAWDRPVAAVATPSGLRNTDVPPGD